MSGLFDVTYDGHGSAYFMATPAAIPSPVATIETDPGPVEVDGYCAVDEFCQVDETAAFELRPYQHKAVSRIAEEMYGKPAIGDNPAIDAHNSVLLVMATGLGKTVVVAEAIRKRRPGKALIIAHRAELIYQAKATLETLTGEPVSIEMADRYARMDHNIVVATVQTLITGMGGDGRMIAFDPDDFSLLVTDEGHHAPAASYKRIYEYFHRNPKLKHLGVTATPDRADEAAMGQVFESVAMTYEIADAIRDGWLVPIKAVPIHVAGLDYSSIRTTAGDLNGADLARVMEVEAPLHEMTQAIVEVVCQAPQDSLAAAMAHEDEDGFAAEMQAFVAQYPPRKTVIFAASVAHAERLSEILNRWMPGRSCWVCGKTPKDERAQLFADYKAGRYAFLVNVGVCTEGFDEPSIEVVVMARPTKSRALYAQMLGRGTRALPGVVDGPETPDDRKAAIAASDKPALCCVDFVGNCGKHCLMTPADILGGNYDDDVVERAAKIAQKEDRAGADVQEALDEAKRQVEAEKARDVARRAKVRVGGKYQIGHSIDPFKMFNVVPQRERGWERGKPVTDKMRQALERQKLWEDGMSFSTARQLLQGMGDRREKGLCSFRQANLLCKNGLPPNVSFDVAKKWIDRIAGNQWRVPADIRAEASTLGG